MLYKIYFFICFAENRNEKIRAQRYKGKDLAIFSPEYIARRCILYSNYILWYLIFENHFCQQATSLWPTKKMHNHYNLENMKTTSFKAQVAPDSLLILSCCVFFLAC